MKKKFTKTHEWVSLVDEKTIRLGLSQFALEEIGEITQVAFPPIDSECIKDSPVLEIESSKSINEISSPVSGKISRVNINAVENPFSLNEVDENDCWLIEINTTDSIDQLFSENDYNDFLKGKANA